MNRFRLLNPRLRIGLGLAAATAVIYAMASVVFAGDGATGGAPAANASSAPATTTPAGKKADPPAKKKLTGAELYAINCNRCHPERYPTERTSAQWKTIMLHMRVRANLPAAQAKEILRYLQEDSGS